MKKWFFFILLLITAAGTFIPCCQIDNCCADQLATPANHDKHQDEGTCSPFFACATCPGFVELAKPVQIIHPSIEMLVHFERIVDSDFTSYFTSFWQPPRFS